MTIVNCDARQLEVNVVAYLSQDPVLIHEVTNKFDIHADNQMKFNLPSRLIAKIFMFRLVYGGSAYSYAHDPDFAEVGYNEKQWQEVINRFYNKYKRLAEWHKEILQEAIANKKLVMPTGRVFEFLPKDGKYPETTIKNYPVQGTGADIMSIIRVIFTKLFRQANIEGVIISTVHDSIVVDVVPGEEGKVVKLFEKAFELMPKNFEIIFGEEYNLPIFCEVSVGPNLKDLIEYVEF